MSYIKPVFETAESPKDLYRQAQEVAYCYNTKNKNQTISAGKLHASAVLHIVYQTVISTYLRGSSDEPFSRINVLAKKNKSCMEVLQYFDKMFPTLLDHSLYAYGDEVARAFFVHQVFLANPAMMEATGNLLNQDSMKFPKGTKALTAMMGSYLGAPSIAGSTEEDLFSFLTLPARLFPDSLEKQLKYILEHWGDLLSPDLLDLLLSSQDFIREETKPRLNGAPGPIQVPDYSSEGDYEAFTPDRNWMPNVVMIAKSTLVWLDQLSKKYKRDISRLDQIPDEELDILRNQGFTALWLIGLWQRSPASKRIKNLCGNPEAESSAYSLMGYKIADRLGGWEAMNNLRSRCWQRGIRLASDMVPNHTGIDGDWVFSHGDYFVQQSYPPFPSYTYNGPDLSNNPDYEIKIEDHYYDRTDAAVTFRKRNRHTGETTYIFHGNDGTSMAWNDTAQIDYLNPDAREAVIQQIMEVARNFPIIRFDAAMTLAKRHIRRLWYPKPGTGGDIAGRTMYEMSDDEFNSRIPQEFWREVVDRMNNELPDTLLLAEAFWMMESYFVRTLGMHRVYNSAFMHMLKNQENKKYKDSIKATLTFDPDILKRNVNFMNNPDEDTAIAQFGDGDKYFGCCTLLATMPGLPMFGHGQIEGFKEKYGMEYQKAYWDEKPNEGLVAEHYRRIFPLLKMRYLFSESQNFQLFDVYGNDGQIKESVYAYTNGDDRQMALVLYNNQYERVDGLICNSAPKLNKETKTTSTVSIGQSLRLKRGIRSYMIFKDFLSGLHYLMPSSQVHEEGFRVSLNGYETKVFINIREVDDIDGIYEQLYYKLQGRGVFDIEDEIKKIYLQPFFEAVEPIKSQKFTKHLKAILLGNSSSTSKREVLQTLGSCYTYMDELVNLFAKFGLNMRTMKPQKVVDLINSLETVCKRKMYINGNTILEKDITSIMAATFLLRPFINGNTTLRDAMKAVKVLDLDRFFEIPMDIIIKSALLALGNSLPLDKQLEDSSFQELIGRNDYQGVKWYKGEWLQECVYLALLSQALYCSNEETKESWKNEEKELQTWLKAHNKAGYQLDKLLEEVHN
ncbi:MAG: alpha-amylase [Sphaerochaetaceae bacterium]|nr:alpha-amylase [Sphaerochaetaceae bacterium]